MNELKSPDCRAFLQRVISADKGAATFFQTKGSAINFRQRCYQLIANIRRFHGKIYTDKEPMYKKSEFDNVTLHVQELDGRWRLAGYATPEAAEANMEIIDL